MSQTKRPKGNAKCVCAMIVIFLLFPLAGCDGMGQDLTYKKLVGVWQEKNFKELQEDRQIAYELYFTDDGVLVVNVAQDVMDDSYRTVSTEYGYAIKDNSLCWGEPAWHGGFDPVDGMEILVGKREITLVFSGRYEREDRTLKRVSRTVPYGNMQNEKKQIEKERKEKRQADRDRILAFAADLGEETGLTISPCGESGSLFTVDQGLQFTSCGARLHITFSENAKPLGTGGYYVSAQMRVMNEEVHYEAAPTGPAYYHAPCFVYNGFAIVFDTYSDEIPQEWREALSGLQGVE